MPDLIANSFGNTQLCIEAIASSLPQLKWLLLVFLRQYACRIKRLFVIFGHRLGTGIGVKPQNAVKNLELSV
jgi:hypothetical protein